jgi:hypothetical protein
MDRAEYAPYLQLQASFSDGALRHNRHIRADENGTIVRILRAD